MSQIQDVLKKVKRIELNTRKLVNNIFSGEYHTAFKGQGMTFADFREYVPGDDVRSISWALTARAGKTFVKTFEEEREMTLLLMVDVSGSVDFGTGQEFKGELMATVAATLAFSAIKNNDQVGLLLFSDQVEHYIPPKKGRAHVHRILRDILFFKPKRVRTNMNLALQHVKAVLKKRATIFVISDFMDEQFEAPLKSLGYKHDVIACVIQDQAELVLPRLGLVDMQDAETGEVITIDTNDKQFRKQYEDFVKEKSNERKKQLIRAQVDLVQMKTNEDFSKPLVAFFKQRKSA